MRQFYQRFVLLKSAGLFVAVILLAGCASTKPPVREMPDFNSACGKLTLTDEGQEAMVVSAHATATAVGEWILERGGNSVDATIATLAALNVVEPQAAGIGGGGYALYFHAATDSFYAIDFRERAPAVIDIPKYFQPEDTGRMAQRWGVTSVLVPGCAAGWHEFYSRFGSLPLADILAPAIALADSGFPLSEYQYQSIAEKIPYLINDPTISEVFLRDGQPKPVGEIIRQPHLAALFRSLSNSGLDAFYKEPVSTDLVSTIQQGGGTLIQRDLDEYAVKYREPLRGEYRGYEIITLGPPSGGGIGVLEALEILKGYEVSSVPYLSADYCHLTASAIRIARENVRRWIGDPDYYYVPVDSILSPARIAEVRETIKPESLLDSVKPMSEDRAGDPVHGNTTHLVVADKSGNLMCLTQSINYYFGSAVMSPRWGYVLNNLMADFDHDTTGINSMHPYHRPASTMACTMILKDGKPLVVVGTPGGTRIASTMTQVIVAMLDYGLSLEEALDAPRFYTAGKRLAIESRFTEEVRTQLAAKGWKMDPMEAYDAYFGGVNAIYINPETGEMIGCSDPRRDGAAAGF